LHRIEYRDISVVSHCLDIMIIIHQTQRYSTHFVTSFAVRLLMIANSVVSVQGMIN